VARSSRAIAPALVLAGAVLVLDQASKWMVRHRAASLPWRPGAGLRIEVGYNPGISFSQLTGSRDLVFALVAAVAAGVAVALFLAPPRYRMALGVILGGALGNLVDRVRFDGAVLDFIGLYSWPTFNVADAAIVVGTILLLVQVLRVPRA
jgi:signal peptidase II